MRTRLAINLERRPYPYPEEPGADQAVWGEVTIRVIPPGDEIVLLRTQWDLPPVMDWFRENRSRLCHEELIVEGERPLPGESLADALERRRAREFADDREDEAARWFAAIYDYYRVHGLRRVLQGAHIPDIVIGRNHGLGEISLADDEFDSEGMPEGFHHEPGPWAYSFDLAAFCAALEREIALLGEERTRSHMVGT